LRHPKPATPQAGRDSRTELARAGQLDPVERAHRLDPAHRAGEEDLSVAQVVQGQLPLACIDSLRPCDLDRLPAGDAGQDPPVRRGGCQPALAGNEDAASGCLQHGAVRVDEQGQLPSWRRCAGALEQPPVGPLVIAEAAFDNEAAQRDSSLRGWEDLVCPDLGCNDPGAQPPVGGCDSEPQFAVAYPTAVRQDGAAGAAGELGVVKGAEAAGEALEVAVELDWPAFEDEDRLEDAQARIGVEGR
jgi:hypothetical protein